MVWDVTVVDALAPSRFSSNNTPAADEAEKGKERKYQQIVDQGYHFQPVAFEAQGKCGSGTSEFLTALGRKLVLSTKEPRASTFFRQRISIIIQQNNAACVTGTARDLPCLEEVFMF